MSKSDPTVLASLRTKGDGGISFFPKQIDFGVVSKETHWGMKFYLAMTSGKKEQPKLVIHPPLHKDLQIEIDVTTQYICMTLHLFSTIAHHVRSSLTISSPQLTVKVAITATVVTVDEWRRHRKDNKLKGVLPSPSQPFIMNPSNTELPRIPSSTPAQYSFSFLQRNLTSPRPQSSTSPQSTSPLSNHSPRSTPTPTFSPQPQTLAYSSPKTSVSSTEKNKRWNTSFHNDFLHPVQIDMLAVAQSQLLDMSTLKIPENSTFQSSSRHPPLPPPSLITQTSGAVPTMQPQFSLASPHFQDQSTDIHSSEHTYVFLDDKTGVKVQPSANPSPLSQSNAPLLITMDAIESGLIDIKSRGRVESHGSIISRPLSRGYATPSSSYISDADSWDLESPAEVSSGHKSARKTEEVNTEILSLHPELKQFMEGKSTPKKSSFRIPATVPEEDLNWSDLDSLDSDSDSSVISQPKPTEILNKNTPASVRSVQPLTTPSPFVTRQTRSGTLRHPVIPPPPDMSRRILNQRRTMSVSSQKRDEMILKLAMYSDMSRKETERMIPNIASVVTPKLPLSRNGRTLPDPSISFAQTPLSCFSSVFDPSTPIPHPQEDKLMSKWNDDVSSSSESESDLFSDADDDVFEKAVAAFKQNKTNLNRSRALIPQAYLSAPKVENGEETTRSITPDSWVIVSDSDGNESIHENTDMPMFDVIANKWIVRRGGERKKARRKKKQALKATPKNEDDSWEAQTTSGATSPQSKHPSPHSGFSDSDDGSEDESDSAWLYESDSSMLDNERYTGTADFEIGEERLKQMLKQSELWQPLGERFGKVTIDLSIIFSVPYPPPFD
ncbi:hypothetical protein BLNAU_16524 [Blattamonas nauphoetae]|uniref:Uncharacterized protein n=1 Tax=Blattamonas nauphoetae TaxID=2049346 RepID=A0ABQ9X8C9_9EUKA|nr:hypothetical protein BLNAU_16524 [Blattamonas nauphoetae]